MSERDDEAEMSVRDAILTLISSGARAYCVTVPYAAERSLVARSGRTLNFAEANERINTGGYWYDEAWRIGSTS
jgi:hypothetical protein